MYLPPQWETRLASWIENVEKMKKDWGFLSNSCFEGHASLCEYTFTRCNYMTDYFQLGWKAGKSMLEVFASITCFIVPQVPECGVPDDNLIIVRKGKGFSWDTTYPSSFGIGLSLYCKMKELGMKGYPTGRAFSFHKWKNESGQFYTKEDADARTKEWEKEKDKDVPKIAVYVEKNCPLLLPLKSLMFPTFR